MKRSRKSVVIFLSSLVLSALSFFVPRVSQWVGEVNYVLDNYNKEGVSINGEYPSSPYTR
jgi:hypothetical protein